MRSWTWWMSVLQVSQRCVLSIHSIHSPDVMMDPTLRLNPYSALCQPYSHIILSCLFKYGAALYPSAVLVAILSSIQPFHACRSLAPLADTEALCRAMIITSFAPHRLPKAPQEQRRLPQLKPNLRLPDKPVRSTRSPSSHNHRLM
jgi:hypothetical protein